MIVLSLRSGLRAAGRPALIALLWAWNLLLAGVTAYPAWTWWSRTTFAPESERLVDRFSFGLFVELMQDGGSSAWGVLTAGVIGLALVAPASNALVSGGVLEVLLSRDSRPFMHRFFRGAGHFFWRFVLLLVVDLIVALIIIGVVNGLVGRLLRPLSESAWEPGWFVALLLRAAIIFVLLAYFLMVLDYARIRVAIEDTRRTLRTWMSSLLLVATHPVKIFGVLIGIGVLSLAVVGAYVAFRGLVPSNTTLLIGLMVAVQQAFIAARTSLRVALVASELELYRRLRPPALEVPEWARREPLAAGAEEAAPPLPPAGATPDEIQEITPAKVGGTD